MALIRKSRIPSIPYLEQKISEIGAIANPSQEEIQLLTHYKKLTEQCKTLETHLSKDRVEDAVSKQT
jgi:hypothetical protein